MFWQKCVCRRKTGCCMCKHPAWSSSGNRRNSGGQHTQSCKHFSSVWRCQHRIVKWIWRADIKTCFPDTAGDGLLGDISVLDKVYIVCGRTDMRKQIDGLCVIIEEQLKMNTNDNCLFLSCYRPHELSRTCSHELSPDCLTFCHQPLQGWWQNSGGNKIYVVMVPSISCSVAYVIM